MVRMHGERPFDEEEYERQGGVFVPVNGGHEVGCEDKSCAPDELVEDTLNDDGVPGTPDDLPYDYGVEVPDAVDQQVLSPEHRRSGYGGMGQTGAPARRNTHMVQAEPRHARVVGEIGIESEGFIVAG